MAGKPTEAQVKEFWEWCGLKQNSFGNWGMWNGVSLDLLSDESNWGDNNKIKTPHRPQQPVQVCCAEG
ncbi:hypothetical protein LCGC14_2212530 [marine sediment metagenome]|uniref:Uncharacterized protein n=1 Tax=marine sediment metagenome TaxID=412755 RepID=A0A0F9DDA0_9ZZZZ